MFGLTEPKRLYQKIGRDIRQQIASGVYEVGTRLPAERDIAEQLGVSRTIVREALIMLELEGLIEVRKGSGIHVISNISSLHAANTSTPQLTDVGPFELLQARQLVESHIAAFAATQLNKTNLQNMQAALTLEKQEIEQGVVGGKADELFHIAVAEATQNSALVALVQHFWDMRAQSPMWERLHAWIEDTSYREEWVSDHQNIIDALSRKNPEAAREAMWQHLENVKTTLLRVSDKNAESFDRYLFDSTPAVL